MSQSKKGNYISTKEKNKLFLFLELPIMPSKISRIWKLYSPQERRNIMIYIIGIMLYKFGLEAFNGSIVTLATNRYDQEAFRSNSTMQTFGRVGLLSGLNQACQCIGSILIAPLTIRWPTRTVLVHINLCFRDL